MVENFRNIRVLQISNNSLVTTYLTNRLDNSLTDQEYLIISFKFTDFLEFIGTNKNHYQVEKLGKFLKYLQTLPPMLSTISNTCFQSVNIFPYLKVFKKKILVCTASYCGRALFL